jgi:hypothetical protein
VDPPAHGMNLGEISRKTKVAAMREEIVSNKLAGKIASVTGGSRSIEAAIAKRLTADNAAVALKYAGAAGAGQEVVRAIETRWKQGDRDSCGCRRSRLHPRRGGEDG